MCVSGWRVRGGGEGEGHDRCCVVVRVRGDGAVGNGNEMS